MIDGDMIGTVRRLVRESEHRAQRQSAMAAVMERRGDRHGATIARELLRIEQAALRLALDRLRRLERARPWEPDGDRAGAGD